MSVLAQYIKDPDATIPYTIDWGTSYLGTATIGTAAWVVPSGLVLGSASYTTDVATAWISGGTVGHTYVVTNRITASNGLIDDRSISIVVEDR